MHYTVYKTTNQVNGKFYIGTHKTIDLNDDYLGSGTLLKRAIEKYGVENFKREILFVFDNPEEMFAKEAEIVTDDFLAENNTYNLKRGGFGGFDYANSEKFDNPAHKKHHLQMMTDKRKVKFPNGVFYGKKHSEGYSEKMSIIKKGQQSFLGKSHSEQTKNIIGSKNSVSQRGNKNSQYGTRWITDGQKNMKIKFNTALPDGWKLGRVLRKVT
jgi:group I intron endonuclease